MNLRNRRPRRPPTDPPSSRPSSSVPPESTRLVGIESTTRRLGLAIVAAGVIARCTWPGEVHDEIGTGQGLPWVLLILLGLAIAAAGAVFSGRTRFRFGWVDVAVSLLFLLVAASAGHAADGRVAQNLAWEWAGVGLAYLAVRWLAIEASETRAWIAALVAIGFALSAYGVYQVAVLQPETRRLYLQDPESALQRAGIPNDPIARRQFEDRLLGSREPTSTFALANSLAGSLLIPLLVTAACFLTPLHRRASLAAIPLVLVMLPVFVLTKGRGAYVGLALGLLILGVRLVKNRRRLALGVVGALVVVAAIGAALSLLGKQDRLLWNNEVWSESVKSLSYRGEYFAGTWNILTSEPGVWWSGLGPGNFGGAYLRHKLAQASESISDPHNLFLEVWTTAGMLALIAMIVAIGLGIRELFAPDRLILSTYLYDIKLTRLLAWGLPGMVLALFLRPDLGPFSVSENPFEGDLIRWLILSGGWLCGAWLAWRIVRDLGDRTLVVALGAGIVALVVDLLITGGIGFAPVSLGLWTALAAGLNMRVDRASGVVRETSRRAGAIVTLAITAAIAGLFFGTMGPHYAAIEAIERADRQVAMARQAMQAPVTDPYRRAEPYYVAASDLIKEATKHDPLAGHPWIRWAWLELENWEASGRPTDISHLVWHRIEDQLTQAATPPRDPKSAAPSVAAMPIATRVLAAPGWPESERKRILEERAQFARTAAGLNPTSAMVQAAHAEAAWAAGHGREGYAAAARALQLDAHTPHIDKKLTENVRARLDRKMTEHQEGETSVEAAPSTKDPAP